ncbi:unnamed protein product [Calicophoron daubneyi]|uniref:Uncharacterized protein n=1 Tax=Calicophoron daubneyi TaxID=300641 RepID=A0AAV2U150_CALDB
MRTVVLVFSLLCILSVCLAGTSGKTSFGYSSSKSRSKRSLGSYSYSYSRPRLRISIQSTYYSSYGLYDPYSYYGSYGWYGYYDPYNFYYPYNSYGYYGGYGGYGHGNYYYGATTPTFRGVHLSGMLYNNTSPLIWSQNTTNITAEDYKRVNRSLCETIKNSALKMPAVSLAWKGCVVTDIYTDITEAHLGLDASSLSRNNIRYNSDFLKQLGNTLSYGESDPKNNLTYYYGSTVQAVNSVSQTKTEYLVILAYAVFCTFGQLG